MHAHPLRVDQDVRDQRGGRPIEVGSKWTVSDLVGMYGWEEEEAEGALIVSIDAVGFEFGRTSR